MCLKCDTCGLTLHKGDQIMRIHGVVVHARVNCAWKTALKYGPSRNIPAETYDPDPKPAARTVNWEKVGVFVLFSPVLVMIFAFIMSVLKDLFKGLLA